MAGWHDDDEFVLRDGGHGQCRIVDLALDEAEIGRAVADGGAHRFGIVDGEETAMPGWLRRKRWISGGSQ